MTPCEELGYKVGDKFKVIGGGQGLHCVEEKGWCTIGDTLTLVKDDGTSAPKFLNDNSTSAVGFYYYLDSLEPIKKDNKWHPHHDMIIKWLENEGSTVYFKAGDDWIKAYNSLGWREDQYKVVTKDNSEGIKNLEARISELSEQLKTLRGE